MAFTRTFKQLRDRSLYLGDIDTESGDSNRHPEADVNTEINASYRKFLSVLKTKGFDFNLIETAQANLPTTRADTNEAYSEVAWPDGSKYIKRIDVIISGEWSELTRRDWAQLRSEFRSGSATFPRPLVWAPKSEGSVSGSTFTSGKIAIAPFCPNGKYKITYQPDWVDAVADGDIFLFPDENCSEWVIWDVVCKYAARDRDNKKQYSIADTERKNCAIAMGEFIPEIVDTGPLSMTRDGSYFV